MFNKPKNKSNNIEYLGYEFRIYPDDIQEELINKTFGCARLAYNTLLDRAIKYYKETGKFKIDKVSSLKEEFPFMKEVDVYSLVYAQLNLRSAFLRFFSYQEKKNGRKVGYPKFKAKKDGKMSYTTACIKGSTSSKYTIRIEEGKLRLPKIGLVKIKLHRYIRGTIKNVTIKKTKSGKYFACITTEAEKQEKYFQKKNLSDPKVLGIDYSSHDFAVYSSGEKANPPRSFRKYEKKLSRQQRSFSRRQKDSRRREKQRIKVAKTYEKMSNIRKNFVKVESSRIAEKFDAVVVEDLNLQGLSKSLHLGKATMDNGFGMFKVSLQQKIERRGGLYIKAPKFFPSSQLCSNCGFQNKEVKNLAIRNWVCPNCGEKHDRDINAAINLELLGHYVIENTGAMLGIYAQGDSVRPVRDYLNQAVIDELRKVIGKDPISLL